MNHFLEDINLNEPEEKGRKSKAQKFVVAELVFSMDGDQAPFQETCLLQ